MVMAVVMRRTAHGAGRIAEVREQSESALQLADQRRGRGIVRLGRPAGAMTSWLITQDARFAAAENGGGFYGLEEAATVVTILGRA